MDKDMNRQNTEERQANDSLMERCLHTPITKNTQKRKQ